MYPKKNSTSTTHNPKQLNMYENKEGVEKHKKQVQEWKKKIPNILEEYHKKIRKYK